MHRLERVCYAQMNCATAECKQCCQVATSASLAYKGSIDFTSAPLQYIMINAMKVWKRQGRGSKAAGLVDLLTSANKKLVEDACHESDCEQHAAVKWQHAAMQLVMIHKHQQCVSGERR